MEIKQLEPAVVERDENGEWLHPVYAEYCNKNFSDDVDQEKWDAMLNHFGIKVKVIELADDISMNKAWWKMFEDCDLSLWNPEVPEGFFLIAIHFTEEDAVATFAREIRECEVA